MMLNINITLNTVPFITRHHQLAVIAQRRDGQLRITVPLGQSDIYHSNKQYLSN